MLTAVWSPARPSTGPQRAAAVSSSAALPGPEAGRAGCNSGADLHPHQLPPHQELIAVLDEGRCGDAEERAVGAAHVLHRESLPPGVQHRVPAGDESITGEGDVAHLAAQEILSLAEAEGGAPHAALEELDDAQLEPRVCRPPGDGAA